MRLGWALALLLPCAPAWAEGFAARGLGSMESAELCAKKAAKLLDAYMGAHGGDEVLATPNAVYGWDFLPGEGDVMLMCPSMEGQPGVAVMVVVHSDGTDAERDALADAVAAMWVSG